MKKTCASIRAVWLAAFGIFAPAALVAQSGVEVVWDNASANKNIWDLSSRNWHVQGMGNGSTNFIDGYSARFNAVSATAIVLGEDVRVADLVLNISGNNVYWSLAGGHELSVSGGISITDSSSGSGVNAIDSVKLSGAGGVTHNVGAFRIGNSGNDFEGGVVVVKDNLDAVLNGAGATPLGTGPVTLGIGPISGAASLTLAAASDADMFIPELRLPSGMAAGKLLLRPGANTLAVSVGSLVLGVGASLQTDVAAPAQLFIGGLQSGLLPPWMVSGANGGDYLENAGGEIMAIADYSAFPSIFNGSGATLAGDASAGAARLAGSNDLGGFTFSAGALILGANNASVNNGTLALAGDDAWVYVGGANNASISASIAGPARIRKFGSGRLALNTAAHGAFVQEGVLSLAQSGVVDAVFAGPGTLEIAAGADIVLDGDSVVGTLSLPDRAKLALGDGVRVEAVDRVYMNKDSALTLDAGATLVNGKNAFVIGDANNNGGTLAVNRGAVLDLNNSGLLQINNYPHDNRIFVNGGVVTNAATIGQISGEHGTRNSIAVRDGGRVHAAELRVGHLGTYGSATIIGSGTEWDNGGGKIVVGYSSGSPNPAYNSMVVSNGAALRNVGAVYVPDNGGGGGMSFMNTLQISSGAEVESSGTIYVAHVSGGNAVLYDNAIIVSDPGTAWRGNHQALFVGNANEGYACSNAFVVANGASVAGIGEVRVGRHKAQNAWANAIIVTNGASLSTHGAVSISYPESDRNRGWGFENRACVGGGPLGGAVWNMNNAELIIGDCRDGDRYRALTNSFTLAAGGVVTNAAAVLVGRAPAANSHQNALILDGGELFAASLTVNPSNILDVVLGAGGVKPAVLGGSAILAAGSIVRASVADPAQTGRYHPIIRAPNGVISDNGLVFAPEDSKFIFKLRLNAEQNELSLGAFDLGTLMILR